VAEARLGVTASANAPSFAAESKNSNSDREQVSAKKTVIGRGVVLLNFGSVGSAMRRVVETLPNGRLWILIDEWSEVPLELQPFLADLLRRAVLPTKGITVKIAAIEQRSRMLIPDVDVENIGFELGADLSAQVDLDDYIVFDNDEAKAVAFLKALVLKHVQVALQTEGITPPQNTTDLLLLCNRGDLRERFECWLKFPVSREFRK
jgi:hypothetical protein